MKLVTVSQMKAIEKEADAGGLTYDQMMEARDLPTSFLIYLLMTWSLKQLAWWAPAITAVIRLSL